MPIPDIRKRDSTNGSAPPLAERRRRRLRRAGHGHTNHDRWLVSYADFVTLLFAFFTTMYAMSHVDAQKLSAMVGSMHVAFNTRAYQTEVKKIGVNKDLPVAGDKVLGRDNARAGTGGPKEHQLDLAQVEAVLTKQLAPDIHNKLLDIERDRRGLVISIRQAGSFGIGSATLSPQAKTMLDEIGRTLDRIGNHIRVEGYTDNTPIHTAQFQSNWELSTTRATNVVAFLLAHSHVAPERVSAAGYGEYHPRVPNTSAANRALNRRVDIVILNPMTEQAEEPGPTEASHD